MTSERATTVVLLPSDVHIGPTLVLLLSGILLAPAGCNDDGNCVGEACPSAEGSTTGVSTGSTSAEGSTDPTAGSSSSGVGPGETTSTSAVDDTSGTGEGQRWCLDADGDGWGTPEQCLWSVEPVPDHVVDDTDCDDASASTFPGAAELDGDARACMKDDDDDGWGDVAPPDGVVAGSDCDDASDVTFPGAAAEQRRLCARNADGDGWGDDTPPAGVDVGDDCDDLHAQTFPGAAELEPELCGRDDDDDQWADIDPPAGVDAGSDCDDDDPATFPGAAELEADPGACLRDGDDDGWGDAQPSGAVPGGSDCYDTNPDLNPGAMVMTSLLFGGEGPAVPRALATVDQLSGLLSPVLDVQDPMGGIPYVNPVSATVSEAGDIYVNDIINAELYRLEYVGAGCGMGIATLSPVGMPYGMPGYVVCGLQSGPGGELYGIDIDDALLTFDPATGQISSSTPIMLDGMPLDIESCGMAYDCANDELLVMNGIDRRLYAVDPTGVAEIRLDISAAYPSFTPVGLEYDPVGQGVYISTGTEFLQGDIDGSNSYTQVGYFAQTTSNLQLLPTCS